MTQTLISGHLHGLWFLFLELMGSETHNLVATFLLWGGNSIPSSHLVGAQLSLPTVQSVCILCVVGTGGKRG